MLPLSPLSSDDHANGGAGDGSNGTGNNSAMQITIRADEENREVNDDELAKEEGAFGKHSVKLECPHCHVKCVTFKVSRSTTAAIYSNSLTFSPLKMIDCRSIPSTVRVMPTTKP